MAVLLKRSGERNSSLIEIIQNTKIKVQDTPVPDKIDTPTPDKIPSTHPCKLSSDASVFLLLAK